MAVVHREAVTERHRIRQLAIAGVVAGRLEASLVAMPTLGQDDLEVYVAQALPMVAGGQRVAAETAADYATLLGRAQARRARGRPVDVEQALTRSGVLVTPESRSLVAPVLRARHLVAEGTAEAVAKQTAASYAGQLSAADLQAAMRVGVDEGAAASELEVHGWRKGLGPDACNWCQQIADNVYGDPDSIPFHDGDRCGVEPELEEQTPATYDDSDIPF